MRSILSKFLLKKTFWLFCIFLFLFQHIYSKDFELSLLNPVDNDLSELLSDKIDSFFQEKKVLDSVQAQEKKPFFQNEFLGFLHYSGDFIWYFFKESGILIQEKKDLKGEASLSLLRLRYGFIGEITDWLEVGFRLVAENRDDVFFSKSENKGQNSFDDFSFDRLYVKWKLNSLGTFMFGIFSFPFLSTGFLFNKNFCFEGLAEAFIHKKESLDFYYIFGQFRLKKSFYQNKKRCFLNHNIDELRLFLDKTEDDSEPFYLFSAQIGSIFEWTEDVEIEIALSYFQFTKKLSPQFFVHSSKNQNKEIVDFNEFLGYSSDYNVVALMTEIQFFLAERPMIIFVTAIKNLGMISLSSEREDSGYEFNLTYGYSKKAWKQQTILCYRWIEADAMLDIFPDNDFGMGGTNYKGFKIKWILHLSSSSEFSVALSQSEVLNKEKLSNKAFILQKKDQRFSSSFMIRF